MKKLLLFFVVFAGAAFAQVPNCQINFGPYTIPTVTPFSDNRVTNCAYWVMTYQVTGFSAISLQFESATGASVPGAFGAYSGTVTTGVNPSVSVACATPSNCTAVFTGAVGWYRVNLISATGSGTVKGTLQGYKAGIPLGGNPPPSGTACPGTVASPCVVAGTAADGAPVSGAPVQVGGFDGANAQTFLTDTSGRQIVVGAAATGAAVTGSPVLVGGSDGTNARTFLTGADGSMVPAHASPALVDGVTGVRSPTDDLSNPLFYRIVPFAWNGTTEDRLRTTALATMNPASTSTAVNQIGAQISEKGSRWVVNSHPATSAQATASIAAEASVRHVVDCVTFAEASGGAVTGATHFLSLRDGAAGAGTILIQWVAAIPTAGATGIQGLGPQSFCGLNLVGTTNTAMTFEFDAGVTNAIETVSISGFNVN
jgi:hypothetical protein